MTFHAGTYQNFIAASSPSQTKLFPQYLGPRDDFDIIIIGSGIGGGILADELADRVAGYRRILVLEAGSYLYPTHVYNICRFANADVAGEFGCGTFWQGSGEGSAFFIGARPQLNFGGRSIFWSGLIPAIQEWELGFFPPPVRTALAAGLLNEAGSLLNESRTLGTTARNIVAELRQSPLALDFSIQETPRALHQPFLAADGSPTPELFREPTGVFNTAELLINQAGRIPGSYHGDYAGLHLLLNRFVEDVRTAPGNRYEVVARNALDGQARVFNAATVVLAGGSIESPKLLRRSSLFPSLPASAQAQAGRGLTDHPTTEWNRTYATHIGGVPIPRDAHAKIVFYSRGRRDAQNRILYPFNVEMNVNHEYWHLRENDPNAPGGALPSGASIVEIKFSFGNCLDSGNEIRPAPPGAYVPEIVFRNQGWMDHLAGSRFPALAGWQKNYEEIWAVLNDVTHRIFSRFSRDGLSCRPDGERWYGYGLGFGYGTVHHAIGTLRMPYLARYDEPAFRTDSVVDTDLQVVGAPNLYVCDMSVMPFSSAANPVRTLAALALRLSRRLG